MAKTPEQKWKETIIEYRKKCQKILNVSKNIRYVGVINEYGRTLTEISRPGLKPLLKSDQARNEFFIISTLMTLRKILDSSLGKLDYIVLKHQKISIVACQKNKVTFYISVLEKEVDALIPDIKKLI
ncbi:MAG: hypothetical protein IH841_05285 [Thaumarchaeota archaeon]|nr:hypothetical protein [Nitrososphaerota archaeon]